MGYESIVDPSVRKVEFFFIALHENILNTRSKVNDDVNFNLQYVQSKDSTQNIS